MKRYTVHVTSGDGDPTEVRTQHDDLERAKHWARELARETHQDTCVIDHDTQQSVYAVSGETGEAGEITHV